MYSRKLSLDFSLETRRAEDHSLGLDCSSLRTHQSSHSHLRLSLYTQVSHETSPHIASISQLERERGVAGQ